MAAVSLLLIPCFYPALLNKTVLFAVPWLPFIFLVFRTFDSKQASVISLGIPLVIGLLVHSMELGGFIRARFVWLCE